MAAPDLDITIDQGEDWTKVYQFIDLDGTHVTMRAPAIFSIADLEGLMIYEKKDLIFEGGVPMGGFPGPEVLKSGQQVRVSIPHTVTVTLPVGKWRYGVAVSYAGPSGEPPLTWNEVAAAGTYNEMAASDTWWNDIATNEVKYLTSLVRGWVTVRPDAGKLP